MFPETSLVIRWRYLSEGVCAMPMFRASINSNRNGSLFESSAGPSRESQMDLDSRIAVLEAEKHRRAGCATYSVEEVREMLRGRYGRA